MEEDGPGVDVEATVRRRPACVGEHVVLPGDRVDARLDPELLVPRRIGLEEELAAVEEVDLASRVVREDVACCVVDEGRCDPAQPTSLLEVGENDVHALVGQVGRERESRRLQTI